MVYNDCQAGPSTPQGGYNDNGGTFDVAATIISRYKLSGEVIATHCTAGTCSAKPQKHVRVVAMEIGGPGGGTTRTGADSTYSMRLTGGTYRVSLPGQRALPKELTVQLGGNRSGVDFHILRKSSER